MKSYLSVFSPSAYEKVIERSRFIAHCAHTESEEEARAFIAKVRAEHSLATHNCYAYIADAVGNFPRFSDDGEPSGTAGMPMLEVIKNKKLFCTAVVVTRYFGGIKLGAGGLVRAYSGCVAENLDGAAKLLYMPCEESAYTVGYESADLCSRYFSQNDCEVKHTDYSSEVTFTVAVKKELAEKFNAALFDRLNGRLSVQKLREYMCGFKI